MHPHTPSLPVLDLLRLFFELFLQNSRVHGSPHVQGAARGEEEEEEEGDREAHRVHYGSSQGAEAQLP